MSAGQRPPIEIKWTPWRSQYIKRDETADTGCALCHAHQAGDDTRLLVLHRGTYCYVLMNLYPYNPGHLMTIPYEHTAAFETLSAPAAAELMHLAQLCTRVLTEAMRPQGFNLGMNLGRVGGAGIDEHLHLHVVPRWSGDTNFMPLLGGTKLVPEALDDTYAALRPLFERAAG
jgi:ATP adenylyltransferase